VYIGYRSPVDGVDALDGSGRDIECLGQLSQQNVHVGGGALVEQLAYNVARPGAGTDHVDRLAAGRSETGGRRSVSVRLFYTCACA